MTHWIGVFFKLAVYTEVRDKLVNIWLEHLCQLIIVDFCQFLTQSVPHIECYLSNLPQRGDTLSWTCTSTYTTT